jgi:hypothetical protein
MSVEIEIDNFASHSWIDNTDDSDVSHPKHYTNLNGVECIDATGQFNFNKVNAIKYIWRAGLKDCGFQDELKDLKKAL